MKRRSPESFGGEYETGLGTVQAVGFGGVEYMKGGVGSHPVFGSMVLVGLDRYVSAVGEYAYNATGGFGVAGVSTSVQDVSGGIDIHPSGMRVVPYGSFGIGGQRLGGSASANGYSASLSTWEGGFNFGGGVRVYLTRRIGIDLDVRGLRAFNDQLGVGLFGRATGGLFFQFN
ncbi:MAG TPA: hypothetical protein VG206_17615 [Terriglobia bacterium]|nr:hypothetical protein [Terriglobia bacterium]